MWRFSMLRRARSESSIFDRETSGAFETPPEYSTASSSTLSLQDLRDASTEQDKEFAGERFETLRVLSPLEPLLIIEEGWLKTHTVELGSPSTNSESEYNKSPRKRIRLPFFTDAATNVTFQHHKVSREERANILGKHTGFRGCTLWFTGLSGSGKTTISFALEKTLIQLGIPAFGLDGDNFRHGLCKNLGFSKYERSENIRRVAEVAKLFAELGIIALASFISPYNVDRQEARRIHEDANIAFYEIYVNTPLEVCESRDPKQLYRNARAGNIKEFTGIDSAYEIPSRPDLVIDATFETETESTQRVLQFLFQQEVLPPKAMNQLCGSPVRQLFVQDETEREAIICASKDYPNVSLTLVDLQWLQVLAEGWATPLPGFMRARQYLQVLHYNLIFDLKKKCSLPGELDDDEGEVFESPIPQSIAIVLPINEQVKNSLRIKVHQKPSSVDSSYVKYVRLTFKGNVIAILEDPEVYPYRKLEHVHRQFATSDDRHPTVRMIMEGGDWLLGGDLKVLGRISYNDGLDGFRKTPLELRKIFADAEADTVFAYQIKNPLHNGHVLFLKELREKLLKDHKNPILLLHPIGGWNRDDDVPIEVRIKQYQAVIDAGGFDSKCIILSIFPSPMLYAGPTEVQWHAKARLAAGVNAYVVGHDPAGILDADTRNVLYDPTHGAKMLAMTPGLPIEIFPFKVAAYDKTSGRMQFYDEQRKNDFIFISSHKMRKYAENGGSPPTGFMEESAWNVISAYYQRNVNN